MKEYLKKLLPPVLLDIYRYTKKNKDEKSEQNEFLRLKKIPRYTENTIHLFGKKIKYVDSASFRFMYDELFKKEIFSFKAENDKPYIIDAGANIGLSVIYFKKLYPGAEIVAFEPDRKVFNILEYNIKALDLKNVKLVNKGLWKEEDTLKFYAEGADGGRVAMNTDKENIIEIITEKLSTYIKDRNVDFLKMDIEGSEYIVLQEIKEYLEDVKNIFVEYHSFIGQEQYLPELLTLLKNAGFRLNINAPGLVSQKPFDYINNYAGMDMQLNIYGYRL